jgi:inhibitor of KinA
MEFSITQAADDMLMVDFGNKSQANLRVRAMWEIVQRASLPVGVRPIAGMTCLGFSFDDEVIGSIDLTALKDQIRALTESSLQRRPSAGRTIEIPICYDASIAPDLERVSQHCRLSQREVVDRHVSGRYTAELIGFLPGFTYMGGLDSALNVPRLDIPRPKVPPGALGITGKQCALYPTASPGGWNLIGRCPLVLFDPDKASPCLLQLGDVIRFFQITLDEFEDQWASR